MNRKACAISIVPITQCVHKRIVQTVRNDRPDGRSQKICIAWRIYQPALPQMTSTTIVYQPFEIWTAVIRDNINSGMSSVVPGVPSFHLQLHHDSAVVPCARAMLGSRTNKVREPRMCNVDLCEKFNTHCNIVVKLSAVVPTGHAVFPGNSVRHFWRVLTEKSMCGRLWVVRVPTDTKKNFLMANQKCVSDNYARAEKGPGGFIPVVRSLHPVEGTRRVTVNNWSSGTHVVAFLLLATLASCVGKTKLNARERNPSPESGQRLVWKGRVELGIFSCTEKQNYHKWGDEFLIWKELHFSLRRKHASHLLYVQLHSVRWWEKIFAGRDDIW